MEDIMGTTKKAMSKEVTDEVNTLMNQTKEKNSDYLQEESNLKYFVQIIKRNIDDYSARLKGISADNKELYDNYRSNNPELHNDLVVGLDMQSQLERTLNKNLLALNKPYFGRIDYIEHSDHSKTSIYLGKNGINKSTAEILIVDWRAPISTVYYDSDLGETSYLSPYGERMPIALNLKRTFEISESKLVEFYDTDVIANDEFLTKYLGKNKEMVLGEIIATIQKEQNQIIRDTPWHSLIVQGVAGSGKTTVAMHRISYLLYNFKEKFRPDEFFVIGSNKMLLNYITGVLPSLDVRNINQMTLQEFFQSLLDKEFNLAKKKFHLIDNFRKINPNNASPTATALKRWKGSFDYIKALEEYLDYYVKRTIPTDTVTFHSKTLYASEDIKAFLQSFSEKPLQEKIDLLNKRLISKVKTACEREHFDKEELQSEVKKYKDHFGNKSLKIDLISIYTNFLQDLLEANNYLAPLPSKDIISLQLTMLSQFQIDLYDISALVFIKKQLKLTVDFDFVSHIIIDEAQDFGVSIFYVLRKLFPACTFTIMGDVTQNIHYDTGMNDWEDLKNKVFTMEKDKFYLLSKSYRNTVEISNYASNVLKKCSFQTYPIDPIVRHGKEIGIHRCTSKADTLNKIIELVANSKKEGYDTIAIICRSIEETLSVQEELKNHMELEPFQEDIENMVFKNGVMVLPIHMTKGLEFDSVILYNPDILNYPKTDADAKLLYVAITRALHELNIVHFQHLSELLN